MSCIDLAFLMKTIKVENGEKKNQIHDILTLTYHNDKSDITDKKNLLHKFCKLMYILS